jgi:hypothetical protein
VDEVLETANRNSAQAVIASDVTAHLDHPATTACIVSAKLFNQGQLDRGHAGAASRFRAAHNFISTTSAARKKTKTWSANIVYSL